MKLLLLLAALLMADGGSCVQFDGQEIRIRHDAAADRLDALLVYRGLYCDGSVFEKAISQMEPIRDGEQIFFLVSNFVRFRFDSEEELDPLAEHVTVSNAGVWEDEKGLLCGAQIVRVERFTELLRAVNEILRQETEPDKWAATDEASLALWAEAIANGHDFIGMRGGAVTISWPLSDAAFQAMKEMWLVELNKEMTSEPRDPDTDQGLQLLARNDVTLERSGDMVTVVIGNPEREELRLEVPLRGEYRDGLAAALRERGWEIAGPEGEAAAQSGFSQ